MHPTSDDIQWAKKLHPPTVDRKKIEEEEEEWGKHKTPKTKSGSKLRHRVRKPARSSADDDPTDDEHG